MRSKLIASLLAGMMPALGGCDVLTDSGIRCWFRAISICVEAAGLN